MNLESGHHFSVVVRVCTHIYFITQNNIMRLLFFISRNSYCMILCKFSCKFDDYPVIYICILLVQTINNLLEEYASKFLSYPW